MAKKIVRNRLNPTEVKKLYLKLKNVNAVAKELGASYMGIRRNLLAQDVTLVPVRPQASAKQTSKKTAVTTVEAITRSVAHAITGDALVQMPPMTRAEFFQTVQDAVSKATRQVGFRPTA